MRSSALDASPAVPTARSWGLLRRAKLPAAIAAELALVAALLWFCLPQSLGGRAGWVLVSGTSMLPTGCRRVNPAPASR
jgi:hypothetical protein